MIGKDERGDEDAKYNDNGEKTFRRRSLDEEAGSSSRTSFDPIDDEDDVKRLLDDDPLVNPDEIEQERVRIDGNGVVKVDWRWITLKVKELWDSWRSVIWVVLMVWGNCVARGLFRGDFPFRKFGLLVVCDVLAALFGNMAGWDMTRQRGRENMSLVLEGSLCGGRTLYFMFIAQILSNATFEAWTLYKIFRGLRDTGLSGKEWRFDLSLLHGVLHSIRLLVSAVLSTFSMLIGAYTLKVYQNFSVVAILPIFSYCIDSVLLHLASIVKLHPRQNAIVYLNFMGVLTVAGMLPIIVFTDYRLEEHALSLALSSIALESLSRFILTIGTTSLREQRTDSTAFVIFEGLTIGIPQLIITSIFAFKTEDVVLASLLTDGWGYAGTIWKVLPAFLALLLFGNGLNSVYRPRLSDEVTSVLEDATPQSKEIAAATLHAAIGAMVIRYFHEQTLLNWFQSISFAVLYVVTLGPFVIGHYPQKLHNLIACVLHRKQRHNPLKSWSLLVFLLISTSGIGLLLACSTIYMSNTVAYSRSEKQFINPPKAHLDYAYRPPRIRGMDILIAHSDGHPHDALNTLVRTVKSSRKVMGLGPTLRIYTKDKTLKAKSTLQQVKDNHIETLPNIGGQTATFLHYILTKWDELPVQTLFVSSPSYEGEFLREYMTRIYEHFAGQGFPIADAMPKSGFLNLGGQRVCDCHECHDDLGWEDTFGLVESMYSASHNNSKTCDKVLLTYGNHFIASAARIRAIDKSIWQTLYDGLMDNDTDSAWAHEKKKMPVKLPGEKAIGRWAKDGVYGKKDTLQEPLLGKTIERLWGVLLQCSTAEVAWHCPGLERGWRINGQEADCGCIDDLIPGFQ